MQFHGIKEVAYSERLDPKKIVVDPLSGDMYYVDGGKNLNVKRVSAPMQFDFAKLQLEGNFAGGGDYDKATRKEAQFTVNVSAGTLDEVTAAEQPELLRNQMRNFEADYEDERAMLESIYEQAHPKHKEIIDAAKVQAFKELAPAKGLSRDKIKDMCDDLSYEAYVAKDKAFAVEFDKAAREIFFDNRAFGTKLPGRDIDPATGKLRQADDKGRHRLAKLFTAKRKVWAWLDKYKNEDPNMMPLGPSAAELPSTKENWPEIVRRMSTHYKYQPFDIHSNTKKYARKKIEGTSFDDPTDCPLKDSRLTLAVIKYKRGFYFKAGKYGVRRQPDGIIHVYKQVANPHKDKSLDLGDKATGVMADSDDEAEPKVDVNVPESLDEERAAKRRKLPELLAVPDDDEFLDE